MKTKRSVLLFLLAGPLAVVSSTSSLRAGSACCQGSGDYGLDADWQSASADVKGPKTVAFSNASFESSRDLFAELNADFARLWAKKTGFKLTVQETHGGTEAQTRSILLGAEPDVVTLDNPGAIDELARRGSLLPVDWQARLPENSAPFTTTVVFVVEKGNPRHIHDWSDLVTEGVAVITPDPRTSGRGQWNYLAALGYARRAGRTEEQARAFLTSLYERVPVLNSSARGATETFTKNGRGDVLLVWESEAQQLVKQAGSRKLEIVTPPSSILVEPAVTWVDRSVGKHENARVAVSFLKYLYTPEAQEIIAKHGYRPRLPEIAAKFAGQFGPTQLFTVTEQFGGWSEAAKQHFAAGKTAEQVLPTVALPSDLPANQLVSR